jgi:hypothetical protein
MNKSGLFAVLGLVVSAPTFAADCMLPASTDASAGLSLVAPEMLHAPSPDPFCATAVQTLASIRAPLPSVATASSGAYVPLTKDDNTPWRFDMSQNGKRMTSAEFDAWMKMKGIRVATGKPTSTTGTPSAPGTVATGTATSTTLAAPDVLAPPPASVESSQ